MNLRVVKVFSKTCQPCVIYSPTFKKVGNEFHNVVFDEVDAGNSLNSEFVSKYGIRNVPTTLFLSGDELVDRRTGVLDEQELRELTNKYSS